MGYTAGLGIGLEIGVKGGVAVECGLLHRLFDNIGHTEERTPALTKGQIGNFVGGIEDTWHVSATADSLIGQGQTAEFIDVGFKKVEVLRLEKVEPVAVEMQAPRVREGVLYG